MQFQSIRPSTGGTYQSARLPIRGLPAIGRYHQNRPLAIDFGRQRSISAVGGRFRPSVVDFVRRRPIDGEIDHQRSISTVGGRLRDKSTVGDRLREKKKEEEEEKKKEEEKKEVPPFPAPSLPAC
ncbi:hypothetical protein BHE74_00058577, partial [Ensete ventricosum]